MKITIVQSEIEEAVRQYILTQIAVKPGHSITMDFSATRGSDGLTAFIDISASDEATAPAPVLAQQVDVAPAPSNEQATAPVRQQRVTRTQVQKTQLPVAETEVEAPFEEATTDAPAKSIFKSAEAEPEDDGIEDVEGSQPVKRSIFSNLSRPSNSEPETSAT